jgi:PspAB-like protein
VSWFDALLGRTKLQKASLDALFGLTTAQITLETEFDLKATNAAGICFKPVSTGDFASLQKDIDSLLQVSAKDSPLTWQAFTDPYHYQWIVMKSDDFTNLVTTIHGVSRELQDAGYGTQLLASVFQFRDPSGRNVYWMYNYKQGSFYPFVPSGKDGRDNATELRLSSVMQGELVIERDPSMWYAMYGMPLER